ncbi:type II secretion system F family protein [Pseudomonas sp. ABC1]|uniref:type II secretion system F family protein n=1 Tax=Pseudomonas sp. ABC1 TaxID=2748080 RepID=UPI0015C30D7D|nr:type II secretion system F family protein [Pseudomonas sp. ABC1]QLF93141.1 type II secretion system F family protein [Pseudomonas sp. ABC1]
MNPLLLCSLLLLCASFLLARSYLRERIQMRQVSQRIGQSGVRGAAQGNAVLRDLQGGVLLARVGRLDGDTRQLLDRLGWRRPGQRMLFSAVQLGFPVLLALLVIIVQWLSVGHHPQAWMAILFALGLGYLLPKRWLVRAVASRQQRLALDVSTMLPVLRILFEVGMTVEQALRVLVQESARIVPELSTELRQVLTRVDAGLELGDELHQAAQLLDVPEVTDSFAILEQLIHQGGGAMASLQAMKSILDDRRMTSLQERVSKMSAKMSMVMMLFLFPALLMVLAGPGFIAIIRALGSMG